MLKPDRKELPRLFEGGIYLQLSRRLSQLLGGDLTFKSRGGFDLTFILGLPR